MYKPNYKNKSIVNLMSSIARARGGCTEYPELKLLGSKSIRDSKNIVLIVIDGLGYDYLMRNNGFMKDNLKGYVDSVFLPTTACAITSFMTGVCVNQHALSGWFVFLKEYGVLMIPLPFVPRYGGIPVSEFGIEMKDIFNEKTIFQKIKTKSYIVQPKKIIDTDYTNYFGRGAKKVGYESLNGFFKKIEEKIKNEKGKKFIFSYWPMFDKVGHQKGIGSKDSEKHFLEIESKLKSFIKKIKGTNTTVILTADHGMIDAPLKDVIKLENHPRLKECLVMPLSGEIRAAYCYVKPTKVSQFENYIKTKLKKYCYFVKSPELVKKGYYGLYKNNPKLYDRIGDYVLIMKGNYIIKDKIGKDKYNKFIGHHGGVSKEEMQVPLVVFRC
ncbi:alkaline phosphatase family protein [Candidatus Pacearchaeota archaeon]|nr:alkaline phosphatase family protein [Candidatus Pacearchaeota archaeon]